MFKLEREQHPISMHFTFQEHYRIGSVDEAYKEGQKALDCSDN